MRKSEPCATERVNNIFIEMCGIYILYFKYLHHHFIASYIEPIIYATLIDDNYHRMFSLVCDHYACGTEKNMFLRFTVNSEEQIIIWERSP